MNLSNFTTAGTFCLSKGGLAEGTNSATFKIVAPNGAGIDYCIGGVLYHKAEADNIAIPATAVQANATTCLYTISLDSSGNVTFTKGDEVTTTELGDGNTHIRWPSPPATNCAIGGLKVVATAAYTGGTTDLNGQGTFYDFFDLPGTVVAS